MTKNFALCILLITIATNAAVIELTDLTFDDNVFAKDSGVWFIRFMAPWCGHCKALEPTWIDLSNKLEGEVHIGDVDATEEFGLARRFNVHVYPTLILIADGKQYAYTGSRSADDLETFCLSGYKDAEGMRIPRATLKLVAIFDKYMNKANLYLYQNPLFTVGLLFVIGLAFGICVSLLVHEIYISYKYADLFEEEEEEEEPTEGLVEEPTEGLVEEPTEGLVEEVKEEEVKEN